MTSTIITAFDKCTGCGLCKNVCSTNAISMTEKTMGFLYPEIDIEKCTKCDKCKRYCPNNRNFRISKNSKKCYAIMANDGIRKNSSSGGVFSILAKKILKERGIVIGCAFENMNARHIIVSEEDELTKLQGSKYVQSNTGFIYNKVKKFLNNGKKVLFSGTPCQVVALKSFLNKSDNNLFLVEVMCHGVASQDSLDKYLKESFPNEKIKNLSFRDKTYGWNYNLLLRIDTDKENYFIQNEKSSYFSLFLNGISLRPSCYDCNYANENRHADITLGDFWGIELYDKTLNDGKGTSLVLINTNKGMKLFNGIKNHFKLCLETPFEYAKLGNQTLKYPTRKNYLHDQYKKNYEILTLKNNYEMLKNYKFDCAILNFWWANNYGATLTAFALQKLLTSLGYSSILVSYLYEQDAEKFYFNKLSEKFARRNLIYSPIYHHEKDLTKLNELTDRFIVGSDQVFRYEYTTDSFFLSFAQYNKLKIAFSASFGINAFNCPHDKLNKYKFALSRFDSISVREISSVNLIKNLFNIDSKQIIDPVFSIDSIIWEDLIKNSTINKTNYSLVYILDKNEELTKKLSYLEYLYEINLIYIDEEKHSIEDYLYLIKNANFIITDSFHGLCFSLIFNKKVKCFINRNRGAERFLSLKQLINLPENIFIYDYNNIDLLNSINYNEINKEIKIQKKICIEHLKYVMNIKKINSLFEENIDKKNLKKYFNNLNKYNFFKFHLKKSFYNFMFILSKNNKYSEKYIKYKTKLE